MKKSPFNFGPVYDEARELGFEFGKLLDECKAVRRDVEKALNKRLGNSDMAIGILDGVTAYFDQLHILDRDMRRQNAPLRRTVH